jgi:hypothetical protein
MKELYNMKNIPTAEEFLKRENLPTDILSGDDINYAMIEFAQMHVKEALDKVIKEAKITTMRQMINGTDYSERYINPQSVYDAYPLTNIK